jgi:hypothetical protein
MKKIIVLCGAIIASCAFSAIPAIGQQHPIQLAQGVYIGPGGVDVDVEGRRHRRYYNDEDRTCARLRRACEHKEYRGEEGMGNCRRYRRMCG